jgi:hypothetical protein
MQVPPVHPANLIAAVLMRRRVVKDLRARTFWGRSGLVVEPFVRLDAAAGPAGRNTAARNTKGCAVEAYAACRV